MIALDTTKTKPITIGALLQNIKYNNINMERYQGIVKKADELGVNVIFYVQGDREEPESHNICNYFLTNKVQGLIISLSGVYSKMGLTELRQFFQSFGIPIVSLAEHWEQCTNILFDNYSGMRDVVKHLIEAHNLKKIFFLRGPQNHEIAQKRFQAYCDVMKEYGYYNEKLISPPVSWGIREGTTSFTDLIDGLKPGKDFEAVVSINDHWAVEASNRLQKLGVKIPEEVSIFGFNNTQDAKINIPPLSTVALPFGEQSELAVKKLVDLIQGISGVEDLVIPAKIVPRQSCGCGYLSNVNPSSKNIQKFDYHGRNLKNKIIHQIDLILSEERPDIEPGLGAKLLGTFLADLNREAKASFLSFLESKVTEWCQNQKQFMSWQNVITVIQESLMNLIEPGQKEPAEKILHQAVVRIGLAALQIIEHQTYWEKDLIRLISEFQSYLGNAFRQSELIDLLNEFLPQVGVQSCYIVFFEEPQPYIYPKRFPEWSRLILGYNRNGKIDTGSEGIRFPTKQLFLDDWLSYDVKYNLNCSPFFYKEYQFGYGIFEIPSHMHAFYCNLIQQIQSSLWGIYLFDQQKHAEEYLTQQTLQLSRSNAELKQFAYVASHDLQEPLRKIVSFSDRLEKGCRKKFSDQEWDYFMRMKASAHRMNVLIQDLLAYSRLNNSNNSFSQVDLNQIVKAVLDDLEVTINQTAAEIVVEPLPVIEADAVQMHQLFQNMLSNALKFRRPNITPHIQISAANSEPGKLVLTIEDNGIGIDKAYHERIFKVFERLHNRTEYEGTGIGLSICKKIVERHNGSIKVESKVGCGTKFIIMLPCKKK